MGVKLAQTNFSSGELDPLMDMRQETGAYQNGVRKLRNIALLNQGGGTRRPGTDHLNVLTGRTRLIPFEFSSTQRYIFALSNAELKVFDLTGTLIQTLSAPWTSAMLFELTFTQAADVMIVCYPTMKPQIIRRTTTTTFTVSDYAFAESINSDKIYQPYYKYADDTVTLRASGTTGSVTLTTSAAYFVSGHVGMRIRWFGIEILITAVTNSTTATGTVRGSLRGRYDIDPIRTTDGSNVVEVTHANHGFVTGASVTIDGINPFAGLTRSHLNGTFSITVVDDNRYTYVAGNTANNAEDGGGPNGYFSGNNLPTRQWDEPAFSNVAGWPGAVTFHEARLWFGGSLSQPDGLWASKINQFFNFDVGEGLDNESIQVTVGSDDISSVRHLVSNRHLQVFTATSEFYVPRVPNNTITPSNISISRQTPYGCSTLAPQPFDGATVYIQASDKVVREFLYTDTEQAYNSPALSMLAEHLIASPHDMSVSYGTTKRGEQYLLIVNEDGSLAVFHSARAERLAGWALWTTKGSGSETAKFDSVMNIGDRIYVSVQRGSAYHLERFVEQDLDSPLDGSKTYTSGSPTATWSLGSLYANKTVSVVSGNYYLGDYTATAGGSITISDAVTSIRVGYNYIPEIETLPVNLQLQDGTYVGRPKRISRVILGLNSTLSVSISGNRLIIRQVRDDFSNAPDPVTGKKEFFLLGYKRDATITITQTEPLPMRVLGLAMEVSA